MKEGTKEKDVMGVVYCRGFKKLLDVKDCNRDMCEYHFGTLEEPIKQRDGKGWKIVGMNRYIRCGVPKLERINQVCEVKK